MDIYNYILENLQNMCEQTNIEVEDIILLYLMKQMNVYNEYADIEQQIKRFKTDMREDNNTLWDLQLEKDHLLAIQHARVLYNILVGGELC